MRRREVYLHGQQLLVEILRTETEIKGGGKIVRQDVRLLTLHRANPHSKNGLSRNDDAILIARVSL